MPLPIISYPINLKIIQFNPFQCYFCCCFWCQQFMIPCFWFDMLRYFALKCIPVGWLFAFSLNTKFGVVLLPVHLVLYWLNLKSVSSLMLWWLLTTSILIYKIQQYVSFFVFSTYTHISFLFLIIILWNIPRASHVLCFFCFALFVLFFVAFTSWFPFSHMYIYN